MEKLILIAVNYKETSDNVYLIENVELDKNGNITTQLTTDTLKAMRFTTENINNFLKLVKINFSNNYNVNKLVF